MHITSGNGIAPLYYFPCPQVMGIIITSLLYTYHLYELLSPLYPLVFTSPVRRLWVW